MLCEPLLVCLKNGAREYVRLLGINAPEISGGGQCYGGEATVVLRGMLPENTRARLEVPLTRTRGPSIRDVSGAVRIPC